MSGTTGQETTLPIKSTMAATDFFRCVIGGISTRMMPNDAATVLSAYLAGLDNTATVRATNGAGSITSSDNVVTTDGTYSLSMPNPTLVWDATNSKSNVLTIAQKGSGTITIDRYNTDVFYDGDGSSSTTYSLSGGVTVSFVTDGTDWIVVGS